MPKVRVFIFGDSHTHALSQASQDPVFASGDVEFDIHWLLKEKNGGVRGDMNMDAALSVIDTLGARDMVVLSFVGTAHNIFGLLKHEKPFWVVDGGEEDGLDPELGELVPMHAMWDMVESLCTNNKQVARIKERSKVPVFHLMTPPPKSNNEFIASKVKSYRGRLASDVGITPPELRFRLWKLEMRVLERFCAELGIALVPPPIESLTQEGFLSEEYYADDATHANRAYGALVLRQLHDIAFDRLTK